jgi:hypothetical protein
MLGIHPGQGADEDLGARFVACFVQAADDAGPPDDPEFRLIQALGRRRNRWPSRTNSHEQSSEAATDGPRSGAHLAFGSY